jgi:hypothetical protein
MEQSLDESGKNFLNIQLFQRELRHNSSKIFEGPGSSTSSRALFHGRSRGKRGKKRPAIAANKSSVA